MPDTQRPDSILTYSCSVRGMIRPNNEDSVFTWTPDAGEVSSGELRAILAVADGMGGHERGEWASRTAISVLENASGSLKADISADKFLKDVFTEANRLIHAEAGNSTSPPGTTLTITAIQDNTCRIAHVGDTRAYLLHNGTLNQVTKDDTLAELLLSKGQIISIDSGTSDEKHMLTKSVGRSENIEPFMAELTLSRGDIILLCSDGLTDMLSDTEIERIITGSHSAMQAGEMLTSAANNAGGEDNISAVIYSHEAWAPKQRDKHATGSISGFGPRRLLIIRLFLLVFLIAVLAGVFLYLIKPRSPVTQAERIETSQADNIIPDDKNGSENLVATDSEITGPDEMLQGSSAQFKVEGETNNDYTYRWICDPSDSGIFSNPSGTETKFTPGDLPPGTEFTILLRITSGMEELQIIRKNVRVRAIPEERPVSENDASSDMEDEDNPESDDDDEGSGFDWFP